MRNRCKFHPISICGSSRLTSCELEKSLIDRLVVSSASQWGYTSQQNGPASGCNRKQGGAFLGSWLVASRRSGVQLCGFTEWGRAVKLSLASCVGRNSGSRGDCRRSLHVPLVHNAINSNQSRTRCCCRFY